MDRITGRPGSARCERAAMVSQIRVVRAVADLPGDAGGASARG